MSSHTLLGYTDTVVGRRYKIGIQYFCTVLLWDLGPGMQWKQKSKQHKLRSVLTYLVNSSCFFSSVESLFASHYGTYEVIAPNYGIITMLMRFKLSDH